MTHKVGAFCELIEFLRNSHARWARDPQIDPKQRKLNDVISKAYSVIEPGKLGQILKETKAKGTIGFSPCKDFLFLKPPDKESVLPVLSIMGDLKGNGLSVRMALFTFDGSEVPAAVGFRFETPHGVGRHNYHHAQMIKSFDKSMRDLPQVPPWLPVTQPALMMSATNPLSLFLGILIGIYGLGDLLHDWKGQQFTHHLKEDLLELQRGCGAPLN
ncbi:MAG TPA: hypothetical protein VGS07_08165 [Thermoanaerobaculia bacterium]|jgi:hypothetical protein|nr:hypothetical protein [Thermoanaerobaculia bacterium]